MTEIHFIYVGNFEPPHSTENEIAKAIVDAGHQVTMVQENERDALAFTKAGLLAAAYPTDAVLLWTRTGWDWPSLGCSVAQAHENQRQMLEVCKENGVPTVGYHLDRWWGLSREHLVHEEPFFRVDLLCTADGGHDEQWESIGVSHAWFPPAVSRFETGGGRFEDDFFSDVCFVGSWQPGYHAEWAHRRELVHWLRDRCPYDVKFWPRPGEHAVRGEALRNLYRSSRVVVGDSCLVPNPDGRSAYYYCSDRVPETLGRGGFLLHPRVYGITERDQDGESMYEAGVHLDHWDYGDFARLKELIELYVRDDRLRIEIANTGWHRTMTEHTYTVRMRQLVIELEERKLL